MPTGDRQDVIDRLTRYRDQIQVIMDQIDDKRSVTAMERSRLQGLYRALKADLNEEVKKGSTNRGRAELTDIERAFFQPAVDEASAHLHAPTNSHPINSNWHSMLYEARMDIEFLLNQLTKENSTRGEITGE